MPPSLAVPNAVPPWWWAMPCCAQLSPLAWLFSTQPLSLLGDMLMGMLCPAPQPPGLGLACSHSGVGLALVEPRPPPVPCLARLLLLPPAVQRPLSDTRLLLLPPAVQRPRLHDPVERCRRRLRGGRVVHVRGPPLRLAVACPPAGVNGGRGPTSSPLSPGDTPCRGVPPGVPTARCGACVPEARLLGPLLPRLLAWAPPHFLLCPPTPPHPEVQLPGL